MPVTPRPRTAVRGSSTGRPVMDALDLLGRRWALRILWELRAAPRRGTELQARCDQMSSSVLYQRLRELIETGLVYQNEQDAYALTALGAELGTALLPLQGWAQRWSDSLDLSEGSTKGASPGVEQLRKAQGGGETTSGPRSRTRTPRRKQSPR